ncbi:unnamed protein product [Sphagnum jensenii]|uniref:Uncharacterized protein n=1 Tax=Sphagnum jensenii TaxID=128206 RepID=A0ABP0XGU2_9BRYO
METMGSYLLKSLGLCSSNINGGKGIHTCLDIAYCSGGTILERHHSRWSQTQEVGPGCVACLHHLGPGVLLTSGSPDQMLRLLVTLATTIQETQMNEVSHRFLPTPRAKKKKKRRSAATVEGFDLISSNRDW